MPSPASNRSLDGGNESSSTPSARATAEIIAISTHDDFLLEIGEALSGQTSVRPVDSVETALEQIGGNRRTTQLLAIDARDIDNLRAAIETLNSQAAHTVVLVFANADAEKQTAAQLKGANIFAVLTLPIDKRKVAAVIEGAVADANSRRPAAPHRPATGYDRNSAITVEAAPADFGSFGSSSGSDEGGDKKMILIGGAVAAVLVVGAAAWFFTRSPSPTPTASEPEKKAGISISASKDNLADDNVVAEAAPLVEMPLLNGTVDELLEKARLAMRERRYTEPNGDNALLFYRSAVKADGNNGEAQDGLRRVAAVLNARFEESLAAGRYDETSLALAHLKATAPDDRQQIAPLEAKLSTAQINKMLADGNIDRAASLVKGAQQAGSVSDQQIRTWRTEIARRQDEVKQKRYVDLAADAIRDGRLSDPADSSAQTYAEQLRDLGPNAAASYQRVMRDLGAAYMRKAREAAAANRGPDVDRWLNEAKGAGVSAAELSGFQREVTASKQKAAAAEAERIATLARDRIREGKLTDPTNDSAAYYLTALQTADANHAYVASGSRELATKLLDRASAAAREGKNAQSETDLAQARRWGADPKDITAIQQAAAARNKAAPTRAAAGAQNGAPTSAGSAQVDPASKLKRTRKVDPEYPERALARKITGAVTLEYTVNTKGEPEDVHVVSAEPAGTFDRAAIAAVRRWRYEPLLIDNVAQEVTTRTTVRFALSDK
ncbi:MAG: energy transducer TonB [Gammaproteobacteria bacterium]